MEHEKKAYLHHCKRCGHNWASLLEAPQSCAKCKRKFWMREKRKPAARPPVGQPSRYRSLDSLEPGVSVVIPWVPSKINGMPCQRAIMRARAAVWYRAKKYGWKVRFSARGAGLVVTRLE